ncbi:3-keto-disaccharide hydrolase [Adhaeretor mobilis]|uniref:3-keto-alpha-glucoside-1,2-lyase/3-keto-2-hydroxy-glucal hydratase domain-containing protein n=1 Tax=Adhaeretor mobilis TaxID=1930276 RepID=A0A517MYV5_9BACT|nr:DUF1080 domain-containing protein [Adhaeretor mobilis]QDT00072.1 hypothetical protein HG15A2_34070 [Adhaeretor mobilis]
MPLRYFLVLFFLALATSASAKETASKHNTLTSEQAAEGWISLFDGETLFGWTPTSAANWSVKGGTIHVDSGKSGFLMTNAQFADFELEVEYRCPPETNSGIFLRASRTPKDAAADCIEVNIAPPEDASPTSHLVGRDTIYDKELPRFEKLDSGETVKLDPWDGKWHTLRIVIKQMPDGPASTSLLAVVLDGAPQSLATISKSTTGHIGLQFRRGEIAFRNIRLRPLSLESIFDGKSLAGWNTDKAEASEFKITDQGELQVLNGRGQLESDKSYGDFLMQFDCRVDGDGLNTGMFFRCIPGDFMMGYECQISNAMKEGDATQPFDCGTGGFFRRQNARRIVAKDHEWFTLTLSATGPQMAAWVNGHQVSDWTDERQEHENPRKGLRTKPGTLAIQGHDPTTDIRFRNVRIVELPETNDQ